MFLTWITLAALVSGLIQDGASCGVEKVNVALGDSLRLDCCEDQNVTWWKDGQRLVNSTGEPSYLRQSTQYSDEGEYFCNTSNANVGQSFQVRIGDKPPLPTSPVCFASPNSTILCKATKNSNLAKTICIGGRYMKTVCQNTSTVSLAVNLDTFVCLRTCKLVVTVSNDFGSATTETTFEGGLIDKVFPDTPESVTLTPESGIRFSASFKLPPTWKTRSAVNYQYLYTHLNETHEHEAGPVMISNDMEVIKFQFYLRNYKVIFAKVCLQVRFRFGYLLSPHWSDYSKSVCNYTVELAPTAPPQNFLVAEDRRMGTSGLVKFSWKPPPRGERNGFIRSYALIVEESGNGTIMARRNVTGDKTEITIRDELEESRAYEVYLTAWTNGGESPMAVQILKARPLTVLNEAFTTEESAVESFPSKGFDAVAVIVPVVVVVLLVAAVILFIRWMAK